MAKKSATELLKVARGYAERGEWDKLDSEVVPAIGRYPSREVVGGLYTLFNSRSGDVRDLAGTLAATLKIRSLPPDERSS